MRACLLTMVIVTSTACRHLRELPPTTPQVSDPMETVELLLPEVDPSEDEISDDEVADVLQILDELTEDPVQLNSARYEDLMRIPAMRPSYARAILRQRDRLGRFSSIRQVISVREVPTAVMQRIVPYVTLGSAATLIRNTILEPSYWTAGLKVESLTRLRGTLERSEAYREQGVDVHRVYQGPPYERYQKVSIRSRYVSTGLTLRGAPGAPLEVRSDPLRAAYLGFFGLPWVDGFVIGRYNVTYGLGLAMGGARRPRRGFDLMIPSSATSVISPYRGVSYQVGHRGVALSTGQKRRLTLWASSRNYTGSISDSTGVRWNATEPAFRTRTEISRRDNFSVDLIGLRGSSHASRYHVGVAAWMANASQTILPVTMRYPEVGLSGHRFGMVSFDTEATLGSATLKTESALDLHGNVGGIVMGEASLDAGVELLTVLRGYSARFQSPYGAALSSWSGRPSNEMGWFLSIKVNAGREMSLASYSDLYRSLLPRSSDYVPTLGHDIGLRLHRSFGTSAMVVTVRHRLRDEEVDAEDAYGRIYRSQRQARKSSARLDVTNNVLPRATWVTRAEWVWATMETGDGNLGYLVHQELSWWISSKTRLQARVTVFNTAGAATRLVAWEPDVGLASALPSFSGDGSRHYLMFTAKPRANIEARIKYARTQMPYAYTMGSGNDQVRGNKRTNLNTSILIRI